ncbi:MAG: RNA polymerase sigma factor [Eubacteriaceae bacterium]
MLELTHEFKNNKNYFTQIVDSFKNSIRFYSRKLNYYCSETDLIIFLLELLDKININNFSSDESLDFYIKKSIKHEYIKLSKAIIQDYCIEEKYIENIPDDTCQNGCSLVLFEDLINILPKLEKTIIYYRYNLGLSDIEIASLLNVSRQTVYKYRRKGLNKLKSKIAI